VPRKPTPTATPRPTGRDEVRAAVLAAARSRLAAEGPGASLRDIAADADVNLGLLYRHFGTKDDLIRAVFRANAEAGLTIVEDAATFDDAFDRLLDSFRTGEPAYPRMLAWMLLSGLTPRELQSDFPTIERLVALGAGEHAGERAADPRPGLLLALLAMYGWQVFADQLLVALGYDAADKPAVLDELTQLLRDAVRSSKPES
jgi:TetR/AcrR family transcriptional regulator, repressor for neighboring sulfatase